MGKRRWCEAREEEGFTLVELMIVVLIMGILVGIVMLSLAFSRTKAEQSSCKANLRTLHSAILQYQVDHDGEFPLELNDLVEEETKYVKETFDWMCPAGDTETESGDYRDHYDPETGEVTCPRPEHNI
jgi:prepilin-type N-terminal cleavage/methylation domain-containing protein